MLWLGSGTNTPWLRLENIMIWKAKHGWNERLPAKQYVVLVETNRLEIVSNFP